MKIQPVITIISVLLAFLFVYAATSKLLDVEKFRVQIGQSSMLTPIAGFVAWFIPLLEIILALMLLIKRFQFYGLVGSFGLMVLFTGYIIAVLQFSEYLPTGRQAVPCACGGVIQRLGWTGHLIFNSSFVLLAGLGLVLLSRQQASDDA
jgi:uncharacterized membrane protein YphA (DoxX/SURF4 family)